LDLSTQQARTDHIEDIQQIAKMAWEEMCPDVLADTDVSQYFNENYGAGDLKEWLIHDGTWFYVLLDSDRVVGFCQLTRKTDEKNIAAFEKFLLYPGYQEQKIAYKLFHPVIKAATSHGITEVTVDIPECSKKWRDVFTHIGVEFETWRKYDKKIGSKEITFWPGVLTIVPGC
jgi:GNAT superfamily N-acetyltransferase